jgi:phenylpropionate dioxygenase-like ring-hydroxylating dioxygenase large terminal subunit
MSKRVSRRDFARASVAVAGAAAVTVPTALLGNELAPAATAAAASAAAPETSTAAAGAAVAKRVRAAMPPDLDYGGLNLNGREVTMLADTLTPAGQAKPTYPNGWVEGTTIPQEYYVDEKHYPNDEQFMKDHFWFMIDHHSRIPKPGDYFTFQFGRGDSIIVVRDKDNEVKGFHNVCRHRGSRLCVSNELLPTGAKENGKPPHANFSVVQLGPSGNTPVFRCPYHAWTYGTDGALTYLPAGAADGFDQSQYGLHPVTLKVLGGFIFVTFADDPPDFNTWVGNLPAALEEYKTADLKIAARRAVPNKCNWKLVIENFRECYHCGPSHKKSYITAHWSSDGTLTAAERARIEAEIARHGHPEWRPGGDESRAYRQVRDRLIDSGAASVGMGATTQRRGHYRPGWVTASLDGKPVAPFLPGVKEYTHGMGTGRNRSARLGFSTTAISIYEDYVFCSRFTPRSVDLTDAEAMWLVHPDAKEGKDYDVARLIGLWHETLLEDRWLGENNHHGIMSSRYAYKGGQPYMAVEGGPAGFVKWYMGEVVPRESAKQSTAG